MTTRSCSIVTANRPSKSAPGSVAKRARTPTHTLGVLKTVSFTDRLVGGSSVSVCTPDRVAWALTKGWPRKRLAWSLAKKTSRATFPRSEEHTSELQSRSDLVCRLLLEKKKKI